MSDAQNGENGVQDDESDETMETLRRENVPENAHISACGVVVDNNGNTLGKLETGGSRSVGSNPNGQQDKNTSIEGSESASETEGSR
jgi:hypothetical protein